MRVFPIVERVRAIGDGIGVRAGKVAALDGDGLVDARVLEGIALVVDAAIRNARDLRAAHLDQVVGGRGVERSLEAPARIAVVGAGRRAGPGDRHIADGDRGGVLVRAEVTVCADGPRVAVAVGKGRRVRSHAIRGRDALDMHAVVAEGGVAGKVVVLCYRPAVTRPGLGLRGRIPERAVKRDGRSLAVGTVLGIDGRAAQIERDDGVGEVQAAFAQRDQCGPALVAVDGQMGQAQIAAATEPRQQGAAARALVLTQQVAAENERRRVEVIQQRAAAVAFGDAAGTDPRPRIGAVSGDERVLDDRRAVVDKDAAADLADVGVDRTAVQQRGAAVEDDAAAAARRKPQHG